MAKGIFLLHGFIQSQKELNDLSRYLEEHLDYELYSTLLPGHGKQDITKTTAEDWIEYTKQEYEKFSKLYSERIIIGFSMGGVLATFLASTYSCDKLVLIAPSYEYISLSFRKIKKMRKSEIKLMINLVITKKVGINVLRNFVRCVKYCDDHSKHFSMPYRIYYGINDFVVDESMIVHIFNKGTNENRKAIIYDDRSHILLIDRGQEQIFNDIYNFIKS